MIIKVMVCKFTIIFVWKQKIYIFATEKKTKNHKKISFAAFGYYYQPMGAGR